MYKDKNVTDEKLIESATYINGELAIKPYYYLRNGLLHIRYTVDRCIDLSQYEVKRLKNALTSDPAHKQDILEDEFSFQSQIVGKDIIQDGIAEGTKRFKMLSERYEKNGHKN